MSDSVGNQQRAQSELLGIVLLFALVLTVSLTVVVVGGSALGDMQSSTTTESAEITMTEFQSKAAQVDSGSGSVQEISFAESSGGQAPMSEASGASMQAGNKGDVTVDESAGSININITRSNGSVVADPAPITIGSVVHERDGERVAYQGGGVFRQNAGADGSSMVSPPNFQYQYRNGVPTLSLPITTINGTVSDEEFSISRAGSSRIFPTGSTLNPIASDHNVTIIVESEYYRAWGQLFADRTEGSVTYLSGDRVQLKLDGTPSSPSGTVTRAFQLGNGGTFTNTGYFDSYNSDNGEYPESHEFNGADASDGPINTDGSVGIRGAFQANNDPIIGGELNVTKDIDTVGKLTVYGPTHVGVGDGETRLTTDGVFHEVFTTEGNLVTGTGGDAEFHDDVVVEGKISGGFDPEVIEGSLYVHTGPLSPHNGAFQPDLVEGSIHVDGDAVLAPYNPVEIKGDIYANGDVTLNSQFNFSGSNQEIHATGDVEISGGSHNVDIIAGGEVTVGNGATVDGSVDAESNIEDDGTISGPTTEGATAQSPTSPSLPDAPTPEVNVLDSAAQPIIDHRGLADSENNDNTGNPTGLIESGTCSDCELNSGSYGLSQIAIKSSDTLTLDTSGGDIELYVNGRMDISGEIKVTGQNQVRIYKDNIDDVNFGPGTNIHTPDDDAKQMWMFFWPRDGGTSVQMQQMGSVQITGVLYGVGSGNNGSQLYTAHTPVIHGAVAMDMGAINEHPTVHFDEALTDENVFADSGTSTAGDNVAYLSVSKSSIEVSD